MVYEIYELVENNKSKLNIFAIYTCNSENVLYLDTKDKVRKWMDNFGLTKENGWDLNNPHEIFTIDQWNKFMQELSKLHNS